VLRSDVSDATRAEDPLGTRAQGERTQEELANRAGERERLPVPCDEIVEENER